MSTSADEPKKQQKKKPQKTPTYEALTEGLGDAFAPLFDTRRADAASGRALTPEVWAGESVSAARV